MDRISCNLVAGGHRLVSRKILDFGCWRGELHGEGGKQRAHAHAALLVLL
jgi:hypothetical protein